MFYEKLFTDSKAIILQRMNEAKGSLRVHLGCGGRILPGWVNIDISSEGGADMVCDLTKGIPLPDLKTDLIYSRDFLEHLDRFQVKNIMNECHRILKPGGAAVHEVPEVTLNNPIAFQDPTHVSFWTRGTAFYWMEKHKSDRWFKYGRHYGYLPFKVVLSDVLKNKKKLPTGWIRMRFIK